ncbi:MAG: zinc ribbon domain-containing protein [Clostridia bacterium]|nr:zinc ribbon domain-containing protein [Clostridia bacterium]
MYCPSCGKQNPDDAKFCENCGAPTTGGGGAPTITQPPPSQPYSQSYQQAYSPPPPPQTYYQPQAAAHPYADTSPMSVGQYLLTMILYSIPIVGLILMFVWAFGSQVNLNKKNLSRAILILTLIGVVLSIIFSSVLIGFFSSLFSSGNYY